MAISMAKTGPKWRGCSRLDWPTWKVSGAPYHTPRHGRAWLRTIFTHSRHISRGPGGQKCFFFMAGLLQVRPAHIRKCSRLYCPITYFPEDPFNQTSQTWRWGCPKYGYFVDKNQAVVDKCGHLGGNNRLLWQEGSRVG